MSKSTEWIKEQREEGQRLLDRVAYARQQFAEAKEAVEETERDWGEWLWRITLDAAPTEEEATGQTRVEGDGR